MNHSTHRRNTTAAIIVCLVVAAYAVAKITTYAPDIPTADVDPGVALPSLGWLGWLAIPAAFTAGQMWRGWQHARGIRRSHFTAIRGGKH